jgi:hypothetical protein
MNAADGSRWIGVSQGGTWETSQDATPPAFHQGSLMQQFTIRLYTESRPPACPVCGNDQHSNPRGLHLFVDSHDDPLCRGCGKKLAPGMAALLDLAHTAERIGRRSRHMLTPPMETLLDLARAAENYHAAG